MTISLLINLPITVRIPSLLFSIEHVQNFKNLLSYKWQIEAANPYIKKPKSPDLTL